MDTDLQKNVKQASQNINQAADSVSDKFKQGAKVIDKKVKNFDSSELESTYNDLKSQAESGLDSTIAIVKRYPLYSLLGAAAVGAVAATLIRRMGRD